MTVVLYLDAQERAWFSVTVKTMVLINDQNIILRTKNSPKLTIILKDTKDHNLWLL